MRNNTNEFNEAVGCFWTRKVQNRTSDVLLIVHRKCVTEKL